MHSLALVYARVPLQQFQPFDLIILESESYRQAEIGRLKEEHKTVLAYLNIGELETYHSFAHKVEASWVIAPNPDWQDHFYIDPGSAGWQNLLCNEIIPALEAKGYDDLLLDSVDLAAAGRYPKYRKVMIHLIRQLRHDFPNLLLITNNAQFLLSEVVNQIDGLLIEEVFTVVVREDVCRVRSVIERQRLLDQIQIIDRQFHLPVFVVDYWPTSGRLDSQTIQRLGRQYHFVYYITDPHAKTISPEYYLQIKTQ